MNNKIGKKLVVPFMDLNDGSEMMGACIIVSVPISVVNEKGIRLVTTLSEQDILDQLNEKKKNGVYWQVARVGKDCKEINVGDEVLMYPDVQITGAYTLNVLNEDTESYDIGLLFYESDVMILKRNSM